MAGMTRFDLYPRDWLSGTRGLSLAARAVYFDLLCIMYDTGRPVPYDVPYLCRALGVRDHRTLRKPLSELVEHGKLFIEDGALVNNRFLKEMAEYASRQAAGRKGGRAKIEPGKNKASPKTLNNGGGSSHEESILRGDYSQTGAPSFQQNQPFDAKPPSPSPSSSPSEKGTAPGGTGADAPAINLRKIVFDQGVALLTSNGYVEKEARSIIGSWRKDHGDAVIIDVLAATSRGSKSEPVEYVTAVLAKKKPPRKSARPTAREVADVPDWQPREKVAL